VTTLVFETLVSELSQDINLKNNTRYTVKGLYPYLLMYNAPAGTFTLEVIKSASTVFSKSFTSADIKTSLSTTDNFAHVFYPVLPLNPLQLDAGLFTIKLSATGYSANNSSFIGWCSQFEDLNNVLDYEPVDDGQNPLALRLKIYKRGIDA